MNMTLTAARLIREHIERLPPGQPFSPADLLELGSRAAVDQNLSRLVKAGVIERVARGVFVRPEVNRYVGKVMPEPLQVAQTLARRGGETVQIHGAEAARRLGLSTQVPLQPVFCTSGPSRRLQLGTMEVRLRHVSARKLALAGRPAGEALAALWYLGKQEVSESTIARLREKLPPGEFEALRGAARAMPAWMLAAFHRFERTQPRG